VARLGERILAVEDAANNLRGKFSGAVGAYNSSSLFFRDPEAFEEAILGKLRLKPATHSTQIAEPEFALTLYHELNAAFA